ncbi:MAG: hypothetical protein ACO3PN_10760, partial [Chthoniobacterales bacterium]
MRGQIASRRGRHTVVAVESYAGVHVSEIMEGCKPLGASLAIDSSEAFLPEKEIDAMVARFNGGDDPV